MIKSLLVIDDDADELHFFSQAVSAINPYYQCIASSHPVEALEKLRKEEINPNFIFLDLNMPVMNGWDCLRELKKIPCLSNIPVIILTISSFEKDAEKVFALGANLFLQKPNTIQRLVESIKKIIEE